MPLNKSKRINEPVSNTNEDAEAFQSFLDSIIAGWKKFWGLIFSGSITFEEFLVETGDFFDKHIIASEEQKSLEYVGGNLILSMDGKNNIAVNAKLYYKRIDDEDKTRLVIQELNNSVGINRFSDWATSKDARELRIAKKLEYPITAPES